MNDLKIQRGGQRVARRLTPQQWLEEETRRAFASTFLFNERGLRASRRIYKTAEGVAFPLRTAAKMLADVKQGGGTEQDGYDTVIAQLIEYNRRLHNGEEGIA